MSLFPYGTTVVNRLFGVGRDCAWDADTVLTVIDRYLNERGLTDDIIAFAEQQAREEQEAYDADA